jgi:hypothetical protein
VQQSELVCCRVGCDGVLMAVQLSSVALCPLSKMSAPACHQLVCLHGMGNWHPTRCNGGSRALVWHHVMWVAPWSETGTARANKQVVGGGDSSCEAEAGHARRRLVVRGEDLSCKEKTCRRSFLLVGDLLEKLPTSRKQEILPVMVLTGVLSPPYLESWPSRCQ